MKLTVGEYAKSRGISEATVKNAIVHKRWELEQNPNHRRQRLLNLEQQSELDQFIPKASPPSAIPTVPAQVVGYDRPSEVGMVFAERSVSVGEITYTPTTALDNPLYQAMQARLNSMKAQNLQVTHQVNITMTATHDTAAAIDALRQMEIVQNAQARAARDFQLEQQAYDLTKQQLEMQASGLAPLPVDPSPAPAPGPVDHSKSPF